MPCTPIHDRNLQTYFPVERVMLPKYRQNPKSEPNTEYEKYRINDKTFFTIVLIDL
jgi:hypothetical protein